MVVVVLTKTFFLRPRLIFWDQEQKSYLKSETVHALSGGLAYNISKQNARAVHQPFINFIFKLPPPVGAGGRYMFSGRPSVPLSVRACVRPSVRPSVIHVVVLCFRGISSICWLIFTKLLSLVHLGQRWTDYILGSKGQMSRSQHDQMRPRILFFIHKML